MGHSSMEPVYCRRRCWNESRLIGAKRALKHQQVGLFVSSSIAPVSSPTLICDVTGQSLLPLDERLIMSPCGCRSTDKIRSCVWETVLRLSAVEITGYSGPIFSACSALRSTAKSTFRAELRHSEQPCLQGSCPSRLSGGAGGCLKL